MRFRGGKDIACGIGFVLALNAPMTGLIIAIAALAIFITRYISSASIISLILLPIFLTLFNFEIEVIFVGYFVTVYLTYKHMNNIIRLYKGTENKIGQKTEPPAQDGLNAKG